MTTQGVRRGNKRDRRPGGTAGLHQTRHRHAVSCLLPGAEPTSAQLLKHGPTESSAVVDGCLWARIVASMAYVTSKIKALPFRAATAEHVLATACEIAELDATDARLLRLGENALFHVTGSRS